MQIKVVCFRRRDKIVIRYDHLLSRCFITIVFTRLVVGYNNDTMKVLQLINHNAMVDFLVKHQQYIQNGTVFEYNGDNYYVTYVVNNVVSAESKNGQRTISVHASLYNISD